MSGGARFEKGACVRSRDGEVAGVVAHVFLHEHEHELTWCYLVVGRVGHFVDREAIVDEGDLLEPAPE